MVTTEAQTNASLIGTNSRPTYPLTFHHLGRKGNGGPFTLYCKSEPARKPWLDKIHQMQVERERRAVFKMIPAIKSRTMSSMYKAHHLVTFSTFCFIHVTQSQWQLTFLVFRWWTTICTCYRQWRLCWSY